MSEFFIAEALIVLFSGIIHGVLGFGFPMIATPLLATFMDLKKAVLYTLLPTIVVNGSSIKRDNSVFGIFKEYKLLIFSVLCGSIAGATVLVFFYTDYYKLLLALVILLYLNRQKLNISLTLQVERNRQITTCVMGFLSGLVGGIANIMIPVLIILVLEFKLEKKKSIGVMNFCFLSNKFVQALMFGINGSFNAQNIVFILPLILLALFGFVLGSKMQDKIDETLYKKILHVALWILSFYLIFSTLI
ncbi:MAG: sulfite exporter TauE/SafE family protein [Sulfurospirillaceae bacterium]|nr:sulfite exporter TauE/SafE family protein [Sulfurospirillaceae bacterium]MDD3463153.1 sulfite exporter TauE/SafE family protein [Sulfurospirillaceae bacterium]